MIRFLAGVWVGAFAAFTAVYVLWLFQLYRGE